MKNQRQGVWVTTLIRLTFWPTMGLCFLYRFPEHFPWAAAWPLPAMIVVGFILALVGFILLGRLARGASQNGERSLDPPAG